jgi:hypothetical protein
MWTCKNHQTDEVVTLHSIPMARTRKPARKPTAADFRAALTAWLDAGAVERRHWQSNPSDGSAAASERYQDEGRRLGRIIRSAMDRLRDMVIDAHDGGWYEQPVAIDCGDVLLIVGQHHDDVRVDEPEHGAILMALPKGNIVRA